MGKSFLEYPVFLKMNSVLQARTSGTTRAADIDRPGPG